AFIAFPVSTSYFFPSLYDSSNPKKQLTLLVTRRPGDTENIIGAGTYIRRDEKTAEVAMAVDDTQQGKGIGTHLLERLALLAARSGVTRFWAVMQLDNRGMIDVFHHSGFPVTERFDH